jgi:transmembrane sensor
MRLISTLKSDEPLIKLMEAAYESEQTTLEFSPEIKQRILTNVYHEQEVAVEVEPVRQVNWFKTGWMKYAAVLLIGILGIGFYFSKTEKSEGLIALKENDIAPGGNKAVLILGNGKKIVLDGAANGVLVKQGNISITKAADGRLVYNIIDDESEKVAFHTIETPNGGDYQINLPDGTMVWLNAASSLEFPTAFEGSERKVRLKGEAYFEVAKNAKKPFKVKLSNNSEVNVLGTHFNINAYSEENTINTTLLEGSVLVRSGQFVEKLVPGQQAQVNKGSNRIGLLNDVDLNQVMAWKNGFFSTNAISLKMLMNQVEKWYDVKVVYKDELNAEFVAKLPRNVPLSELLRLLELTKQVHFKVDGKTITVMK